MEIHNRKQLRETRKRLRNHSTSAEAVLWTYLKGRQVKSRKFRRQHSVGIYILAFYCPEEHLAVELDGQGHFTVAGWEADLERDQYLQSLHIRTIRFENREVFDDPEGLIERIEAMFTKCTNI